MDVDFQYVIVFSISAGIAAIVGEIWYNYSIYTNRTCPDRLAWWMLSISGTMFTCSHFALCGIWTAMVPAIITIGMLISAVLCLSRGVRLNITSLDWIAFVVATVSLIIWWSYREPRVALLANITVSTIGMGLCIRKAYIFAGSEAPGPWVITVIADFLNMFAIGQGSLEWLLPSNLLAVDGLMLITVISRMHHTKAGRLCKTSRSSLNVHPIRCLVR